MPVLDVKTKLLKMKGSWPDPDLFTKVAWPVLSVQDNWIFRLILMEGMVEFIAKIAMQRNLDTKEDLGKKLESFKFLPFKSVIMSY